MKYYRNKYSIIKDGVTWLSDIDTFDGALTAIDILLRGGLENATRTAFKESGNVGDAIEYELFKRKFWSKSNQFAITVRAIRTNELIETDERFDKLDNKILSTTKAFNGKGLKLNAIEPKAKFKLGDFHDPDTFFALSVWRNKGVSTLGKPKKERNSGGNVVEMMSKVLARPDQAELTSPHSILNTIANMKANGLRASDIRIVLKGKVSKRKLNQLIASV